jgi:hypothetical protein
LQTIDTTGDVGLIELPFLSMILDKPMSIYVDRSTRIHTLLVQVSRGRDTPFSAVARVGASGERRIQVEELELTHAMVSELARQVVWGIVCDSRDTIACREDVRVHSIPSSEVHDSTGMVKALLKRYSPLEWCALLNQYAVASAIIQWCDSISQKGPRVLSTECTGNALPSLAQSCTAQQSTNRPPGSKDKSHFLFDSELSISNIWNF